MKPNFSLSGMPDYNSLKMKKRLYVLSIIEEQFKLFGFLRIMTSSIEKRSNLFGSYGNDGDKLIFQILNSGEYLSKIDLDVQKINSNELSPLISNKALRYDLTVPFARFIAKNQSDITFPFKRYEIGSVFRADRPQKGRLRQFVQCDADMIGSTSLWFEVDLINLIDTVFSSLKLNNVVIKISNRKILEGFFDTFKRQISFNDFCVIVDKLDKIGLNKVMSILLDKGFSTEDVKIIEKIFLLDSDFINKKKYIQKLVASNDKLVNGFKELDFIFNNTSCQNIVFDLSLARGLDYYTGSIFEVTTLNNKNGSLLGGGRYDQLTEKFKLNNISGVGISFGLDRICLELESLDLFPKDISIQLDCLFINFGYENSQYLQSYITQLRQYGFSVELYPESVKIKKQMSYANKRGVSYVLMVGEEEIKNKKISIKYMDNGIQESLVFEELIKKLESNNE